MNREHEEERQRRLDAEARSFYESIGARIETSEIRALNAGLTLIEDDAQAPDAIAELLDYKRRVERVLPLVEAIVNSLADTAQVARDSRDSAVLQLCLSNVLLVQLPALADVRAILHGAEPLPCRRRLHAVAITVVDPDPAA